MLTTYDLDRYAYEALAAGARSFLLKDVRLSEDATPPGHHAF